MNEHFDLTEILKDCPKGTKLYSTTLGEVELEDVKYADGVIYPIIVRLNNGLTESFTADGKMFHNFDGECTLFPSKEQRSWSKFTAPWLKKEGYAIAWFEEQGEQAQSQTNERTWLYLVSDVLTWKDGIGQYLDSPRVQEIAKRLCSKYAQKLYNHSNAGKDDQKSIDEVEPKFKVGDWVVRGDTIAQILDIQEQYYVGLDINGKDFVSSRFLNNDKIHLWTINDAKDGDVLAISWWEDENFWEKIIIFKKYHNKGVKELYSMPCIEGYGNTFKNGKIAFTGEDVPYYSKTWTCNLLPATKEQRDLLFQKIKEAGYKRDAETKTLEKSVSDKFDPRTLQPFDKVLCRNGLDIWRCDFFSSYNENRVCSNVCIGGSYLNCIPYNNETKHLVGTTEEAPEYYRYWED